MIGELLEGRTREGPVLVFGWFHSNQQVTCLVVRADGTTGTVPLDQISVDWHFDVERGWVRDFEESQPPD